MLLISSVMLNSNIPTETLASTLATINTTTTLPLGEDPILNNATKLSFEPPTKSTLLEETCRKLPRLSISRSQEQPENEQNYEKEETLYRSLPETRAPISLQGIRRANNFRLKFRKSHTCGSLFAKCNCALSADAIHIDNNLKTATIAYKTLDNLAMKIAATTAAMVTVHQPPFHLSVSPSSNTELSLTSVMSSSGKYSTSGFCSLSSQTSAATSAHLSRDESLNASFDYAHTNTTNTTTMATSITTSHETQFYSPDDLSTTTAAINYSAKAMVNPKLKAKTSLSIETPAQGLTTTQHHHKTLMVPRISSPAKFNDNLSPRKSKQQNKKLFVSYSHPDTNFIFTDANKHAAKESITQQQQQQYSNQESIITTRGSKGEIKRPKRSSSPNIGHYEMLDVAVHPDIVVKISPKHSPFAIGRGDNLTQQRRRLLRRTHEIDSGGSTSESDKSVDIKSPEEQHYLLDKITSTTTPTYDIKTFTENENNFQAAHKYFSESGILGPLQQTSTNFIRKTSKILQDSQVIEQIRKTSLILRANNVMAYKETNVAAVTTANDCSAPTSSPRLVSAPISITSLSDTPSPQLIRNISTQCGFSPNIITQSSIVMDDKDTQIKSLLGEIVSLKDVIKSRDAEIVKLRREIHKLKQQMGLTSLDEGSESVLQQTTTSNHLTIANDEFLQSPPYLTNQCLMPPPSHLNINSETESLCKNYHDTLRIRTKSLNETNNNSNLNGTRINEDDKRGSLGTIKVATAESKERGKLFPFSNGFKCRNNNIMNQQQIVIKKQGVSGESWDTSMQQNLYLPIPKYEKDFLSKHLIKEAIMDNDFLKNIDAYQVKELVDSMYDLNIESGEYVIREGDIGAHLYVSAEGEFEVIKNGQVLGIMGPGKAFGELAILYNCTRTASVRVLTNARVWVLDRCVFQQIMMRTGMQRIEKSVNFLKSVPLLKNLSEELLAKIADVLEVEFYPAGTYIIRQGTKGDTFFLISQGSVKVTQKSSVTSLDKVIRILERGDYFGERALIDEDKRTANIIALAPGVECLTLDRDSFAHFIGDLRELKENNYIDETRASTTIGSSKINDTYGITLKPEYPELQLTDLEVVATLGVGGFGRVELVKGYQENHVHIFALKCLKKSHIVETKQEEHIFNERNIMMSCHTPFICRLYRTFRDSKYVYMLMEPCMGGEIWTMLRDEGAFNEIAAQFIIGCVLEAFEYLHARGIIYRDLKPENLMMDERGYVKLVDFGFAKNLSNSNKTWTFCGTPEYVAPEIILNKGHDRAVDYWALGILIHELLVGTPPFTANEPMKTYNIILKGIDMIDFPKSISRAALQLIKRLCRDIPSERLGYQKGGIQDIKKHKWFLGFDWDGLLKQWLIPPFVRPISHSMDTCYFDKFPCDLEEATDEFSGWDADF